MNITKLEQCTGCTACFSICSQNAIHMKMNSEGFLYPEINENKCIGCGLCEKICPTNEIIKHDERNTIECYAAYTINSKIREKSSSGGVFYTLASKMINLSGNVVAAKFDSDFNLKHEVARSKEELYEMMGSKYLQSDMSDIYSRTKELLKQDKVIFCGTPCQVAGLKKYLGREYENLVTIDIICHGVPSPALFQKYIKEFSCNIKKVSFRNKDNGWKGFCTKVEMDSHEYLEEHSNDSYMRLFLKNISLRKSCYMCKFKKSSADITLGDFWHVEEVLSNLNDNKGISAVIINTQKGKNYFNGVRDELEVVKVNYKDILKYNSALEKSPNMPRTREKLFKNMNKKKIEELDKLYTKEDMILRIKRKAKHLLKIGD